MKEVERLASLDREYEELRLARLNALGFNEPERIKDEMQEFLDRAGFTKPREDVMSDAARTIEAMKSIAAARKANGAA